MGLRNRAYPFISWPENDGAVEDIGPEFGERETGMVRTVHSCLRAFETVQPLEPHYVPQGVVNGTKRRTLALACMPKRRKPPLEYWIWLAVIGIVAVATITTYSFSGRPFPRAKHASVGEFGTERQIPT